MPTTSYAVGRTMVFLNAPANESEYGMEEAYHALAWVDGGLITWDLVSGERFVPVHADLYMATRCLDAFVNSTKRAALILSLEATRDGYIEMLRSVPAMQQSWSLFRLAFPDEPTYFVIVSLILAPGT